MLPVSQDCASYITYISEHIPSQLYIYMYSIAVSSHPRVTAPLRSTGVQWTLPRSSVAGVHDNTCMSVRGQSHEVTSNLRCRVQSSDILLQPNFCTWLIGDLPAPPAWVESTFRRKWRKSNPCFTWQVEVISRNVAARPLWVASSLRWFIFCWIIYLLSHSSFSPNVRGKLCGV